MKLYFSKSATLFCGLAIANFCHAQTGNTIFKTDAYEITSNAVTQNKFTAKAISATEMTSDYVSPKNESALSKIVFKFSINGKDNEMKAGVNHIFNLVANANQTPLIKFGTPLQPMAGKTFVPLKPDTPLKIRLDMRQVIADIHHIGFYTAANGDKIYLNDFKNIYVAGEMAPLSWDFDNLHQKADLEMKDPDGDGIYETTLIFNAKKDQKQIAGNWKQTKNTAAFPQYKSDYVLTDAIYNMSLEEMMNAVEPDNTFRTGKEWAGVWTRDISYSIILSMAYLQPQVSMNSLMRKVNVDKRIIQDTGTGGAYPASTDRIVWAIAAWEVYKATGDKKWLEDSYTIIKNTIDDDILNAYDEGGLVRGESSFLDWREQTYPKWMQSADIYDSQNLGTNAVHYYANIIAMQMAEILKKDKDAAVLSRQADRIKLAMNQYLWMDDKGYYAQYRYGRIYKSLSTRSEALGEALCVLFGVADDSRSKSVVAKTPVTAYGIPCIYPQIPDIAPYHNNAVWPFVQSYWALASAKAGNEKSVLESMAAIARPAALFLTNKENFVADNGDFAGTEINSSNMLWSLSGNIAMVHKVLFGIEFESEKLVFHPFVPQALKGNRSLMNFKYRDAILDISMEGFGNKIKSCTVDGKSAKPEILSTVVGKHTVKIVLENNNSASEINKKPNYVSPAMPLVTLSQTGDLAWQKIDNAVVYQILKNGKVLDQTKNTIFKPTLEQKYAEYQVIAVDANGVRSFASLPLLTYDKSKETLIEMETVAAKANYPYQGFVGTGFVETSKTVNSAIEFSVDIKESGIYSVDFRYANGNGPTNTENKCAIRSLKEKNEFLATFVFPQRGFQEWSNWGFSNAARVPLDKGKHTLKLVLDKQNENMNGAVNQAMLDFVRVVKID